MYQIVVVEAAQLENSPVQTQRLQVVAVDIAGIADLGGGVAAVVGIQAEDTPVASLTQRPYVVADWTTAVAIGMVVLAMMVVQHRVIPRMFLAMARSS